MFEFNPENMLKKQLQPQPIEGSEKESGFGLQEKNKNITRAALILRECADLLRNGGVPEKILNYQATPQIEFIYSLDIKSLENLGKAINMGDKYQKYLYDKIMEERISELGSKLSGGRKAITEHFEISLEHTREKHATEKEAEERLENLRTMKGVKEEFYDIAKGLMIILINIINRRSEHADETRREKVLKAAAAAVIKKANELAGKAYNEGQLKNIIRITIESATAITLNKAA